MSDGLTLAEIQARAEAVANEDVPADEARELALLIAAIAAGLRRGGGASWPWGGQSSSEPILGRAYEDELTAGSPRTGRGYHADED